MRKLMFPVVALLLWAPFAKAADVSGKWGGSAEIKTPEGESQVIPVRAEFQQHEKTVSGTIGKAAEEQFPIEKGQIETGNLSFEFTAPEGDEDSGKRKYTVRLHVVSETQLQGEFDFAANGAKVTGKLTLARDK